MQNTTPDGTPRSKVGHAAWSTKFRPELRSPADGPATARPRACTYMASEEKYDGFSIQESVGYFTSKRMIECESGLTHPRRTSGRSLRADGSRSKVGTKRP